MGNNNSSHLLIGCRVPGTGHSILLIFFPSGEDMVAPLPVAWFKLPLWGYVQIRSLTGGPLIHLHPGCSMLNWPPFRQESRSKSLVESEPQLFQKADSKQTALASFLQHVSCNREQTYPISGGSVHVFNQITVPSLLS